MNPTAPTFSIGTRVAGAVLLVGYLSGFVPGAVMSLVGGLGLMTFGRCLLSDERSSLRSSLALAIVAGALGVGALRWGTVSLQGIGGAESVLGPSIAVGPAAAAAASWAGLLAGVFALAVWGAALETPTRATRWWGAAEVALAIVALAWVFAGPGAGGAFSSVGSEPLEWLVPVVATLGGTALALLGARVARGRGGWVVLGLAAAGTIGAAAATAVI